MITPVGAEAADGGAVPGITWAFFALLILSGLAAMLAMVRTGIRTFWAPIEGVAVPRVRVLEITPVAFLLLLCLAMSIQGGALMRYMDATARSLHAPGAYIENVLGAPRVGAAAPDDAGPEDVAGPEDAVPLEDAAPQEGSPQEASP